MVVMPRERVTNYRHIAVLMFAFGWAATVFLYKLFGGHGYTLNRRIQPPVLDPWPGDPERSPACCDGYESLEFCRRHPPILSSSDLSNLDGLKSRAAWCRPVCP